MSGRGEVSDAIGRLLDDARGRRAGALVLVGEAGIGKTSLLDRAEDAAEGFLRLRATGVESETALGHAGLLQVLTPVQQHLEAVPAPQRRALEAALGWGPTAGSEDPFLVAAATLSVLAAAAEEAPVLVLVDDLHWLDPGTATALLFAARRLAHDPVALLFATRGGSPPGTGLDGMATVEVAGLTPAEAAEVLPASTDPVVVGRLVAATRGNPLALLEAAARLTPAQRRGVAELPMPLSAGGRIEAAYEPIVADLSAPARRAALLSAASRDEVAEPLIAALRAEGVDPEVAIEEAERRGVLVRGPGAVRFRHPLLRTVTWSTATPAERRAAHAALARVLPEARRRARAWHRADAATGPDPVLAAELEVLADDDRDRFGHAAASVALERAAHLSDDPTVASERLATAVEDAALAGDVDRARQLAHRVLAGEPRDAVRGRLLASLGGLEHSTGSLPHAARLLTDAARLLDGRRRAIVLAERGTVAFRLGDYAALTDVAAQMGRANDSSDPYQRLLGHYFGGMAAMCEGDLDAGRRQLDDALTLYGAEPELRDDPRLLSYAVLSAGWVGITAERARLAEDRLAHVRARGALSVLVPVLSMLSYGRGEIFGDHAGAFADAGEAVELGTELGFVADVAPAVGILAWQYAARGQHDEARVQLERAEVLVQRAGTAAVASHLAVTHAFCALCRDDLEEVVVRLEARLALDDGRGVMADPLGIAPLLVEAQVATGRTTDAAALTERYAAVPEPDARTRALVARCRALVCVDDDVACCAFEEALGAHAEVFGGDPFERARTQLLYGARLRRSGQRVAARTHLRAARDDFAVMDLSHWVRRAAEELSATGETARARRPLAEEPLTSQETRIALLVGRGMTNREVAAALFVSPKTVEHHLSSVYRKRGLRSRTELARHLADAPAEA